MTAAEVVARIIIDHQLCPTCMGPMFTHSPSSGPCRAVTAEVAEAVVARYRAVDELA